MAPTRSASSTSPSHTQTPPICYTHTQPRLWSSTTNDAIDGIENEEEGEVDDVMDDALNRAMQTVAMNWDEEGPASVRLKEKPSSPTTNTGAAATKGSSPFTVYEGLVEPPPAHIVYFSGHHEQSFWRQGRDIVQVVVPVDSDLPKSAVEFALSSKTHLRLCLGEKHLIFDQELAQPVYRESSFWYFEQPDDEHKAIVIELDKRLDYSNWPRLFEEDPELNIVPDGTAPMESTL